MTSKATKRKHVIKEVLDNFTLPGENQQIVRVINSCGNNLHQVVNSQNEQFLVSMPTKFRRNVWIKRDDYVVVTSIEEGDKVKAEISSILYKEQIKFIKDNDRWPKEFMTEKDSTSYGNISEDLLPPGSTDSDQSDSEENEPYIGSANPNRHKAFVPNRNMSESSDSEESD